MKINTIILILMLTVSQGLCADKITEIRIGSEVEFPPYAFVDEHGQAAGFSVDLIKAVADAMKLPIVITTGSWDAMWKGLVDGKLDALPIVAKSSERKNLIDFSLPHTETFDAFFVRDGKPEIGNLADAQSRMIVVMRSDAAHHALLERNFQGVIIPVDTITEGLKLIASGQYDAFLCSKLIGVLTIRKHDIRGLTAGPLIPDYKRVFAFGVKKGADELHEKLNQGLLIVKSNGEYDRIYEKWFSLDEQWQKHYKTDTKKIHLTAEEEAWLKNHKTVRVGISPVFPPLKFYEKGAIKGVEPDYLNLFSELTGIHFQYVICPFAEMDSKVKSGEIDMFISFNIAERLAYMTFTEPLMDFRHLIITRNDVPFMSGISALTGKKVAIVKGVKLHKKVIAPYPDIETVEVSSMKEMFDAVSEFKADALILSTLFTGYLIQNYPNLKIAGIADFPSAPYLYAVRKDYPELVSILNKAIASISKEQHDAIFQKWCNVKIEYRPNWSEILKWVFAIGSVFIIILGISLFWNRRLAKEITDRKQMERALRESEERLELVLEGSQLGYWDWNIRTGEVRRNRRWAEMLGYTLQEINDNVGQWTDLIHPNDRTVAWQSLQDHLEGRKPIHKSEYRMLTKDGQWKWIFDQARIVKYDSMGKPVRMSGTYTDITDRKRAEQALRESDERYRKAQAIGHVGNWEYNIQMTRFWGSDEAKRIYGFDLNADNFTAEEVESCIPERERVHQALVDLIEKDKEYNLEFDIITKDSKQRKTIISIAELERDETGRPLKINGVIRDITERKQFEEKRLELERRLLNVQKLESLGRVTAGIAHNFNNILYAVTGNIEMAMDDVPLKSSIHQILEEALKAAERAVNLTHKILAYSGSGFFKFGKVDVSRLIKENVHTFKSVISENVSFSLNLTEDIPMINATPEQIQRVIMNMLVNASEAVGENTGTIVLSTGVTDGDDDSLKNGLQDIDDPEEKHIAGRCVYIEISDTGCGMNEETVKLLSDPFFTTKFMGRGLGMSEVQGIVHNHKGSIFVKSEPGQGSTIRVLFPVSEGT